MCPLDIVLSSGNHEQYEASELVSLVPSSFSLSGVCGDSRLRLSGRAKLGGVLTPVVSGYHHHDELCG